MFRHRRVNVFRWVSYQTANVRGCRTAFDASIPIISNEVLFASDLLSEKYHFLSYKCANKKMGFAIIEEIEDEEILLISMCKENGHYLKPELTKVFL